MTVIQELQSALSQGDLHNSKRVEHSQGVEHELEKSQGGDFDAYITKDSLLNGRYKFIRNIQNGSFGAVSLAKDISTNELVSIKAIPKDEDSNEIEMLKKLDTSSTDICRLLESFVLDSHTILVLEYCSKGDLYDLIHKRVLTNEEILQLGNQLYGAITHAHSKGIFHRDIKPENILIDGNGNFKLCDWGLATDNQFNTDFNIGTEKYIAPELINVPHRESEVEILDSKYTDYWSFGITLLTCIFGSSPFKCTPSIMDDANFKKFVNKNYSILYDIYPSMNSNLYSIVMNLLSSKFDERNVDLFINELNDNWEDGFYVDDYEVYEDEVFEMDHEIEEREDVTNPSLSIPSLIESTFESSLGSMSWLDMDDEEWQKQIVNLGEVSLGKNLEKDVVVTIAEVCE